MREREDSLAELASQFSDDALPVPEELAGLDDTSSLDELVQDRLVEQASSPAISTAARADTDLLDLLHEDYLRVLADPNDPGRTGQWVALDAGREAALADSFELLRQEASAERSLFDLVGAQNGIDDVMNSLAVDHGEDSLLAVETPDNVLHLLAPSHLRPAEDELLLRALAHEPLPVLTRKEHHDLSLDSALDSLFRAQPDRPTP